MAYIINSKGEMLEGQALTKDEAELIQELVEVIGDASPSYIPKDGCKKIVLQLLSKVKFSRREDDAPPKPLAYPVVDHLDGDPTNTEIPNLNVVELPDEDESPL